MSRREKFGKLVLLEEIEATGLGTEYRAAKLGAAGLEKIVTILRLKPAISANNELARAVMDQAKVAAQLQNPNILKIFGIGKVEQAYYISYEHVEGKSLRAILDRCRQDSFPFQVDHALLIASKVGFRARVRPRAAQRRGSALLPRPAHPRRHPRLVRGRGPGQGLRVLAEPRPRGPGPARGGSALPRSRAGDRSRRPPLGHLRPGGRPLRDPHRRSPGRQISPRRLGSVHLMSPTGDDDAIPKPLADILHKSLAPDPAHRYGDMQEMRKAIDTLLFSGDFTPTTFNLAFFMHSLYREDIDRRRGRSRRTRRRATSSSSAEEQKAAGGRPASPAASNKTEPVDPRLIAAARAAAAEVAPFPPPEAAPETPPQASLPAVHAPTPPPAASHPPHQSTPGLSAREAASGFTFHKGEAKARRGPLVIGLGAAAALAAGLGAWLLLRAQAPAAPPPPVPTTLSAAAEAALVRVRELEEKLATLGAREGRGRDEGGGRRQEEDGGAGGGPRAGRRRRRRRASAGGGPAQGQGGAGAAPAGGAAPHRRREEGRGGPARGRASSGGGSSTRRGAAETGGREGGGAAGGRRRPRPPRWRRPRRLRPPPTRPPACVRARSST